MTWQTYLQENRDRFLQEYFDFLRIPSISALPEHAKDIEQAAGWVAGRLEQIGIEKVQILSTGGHPAVYGEHLHAPGKPTVLVYGHFDVQPVDPVDLWTSPPFEPTERDGRIYARGASDDKGNMLVPILAVEALLEGEGALPLNVKFFFEGQEEIGSPQMAAAIPQYKDLLACDLAISADGGQWSETEPAILVSLRGICALQIDVKGAKTDLHSGMYGGAIQNPLHALVRLLDSMRSPQGKILVTGFYDDVQAMTAEDRAQIARVPFDEATFLAKLGVSAPFGEPGFTTRERVWGRPTLELNGIWGGFQGEGVKTVLPNEAHAKITCRLVANQTPARIVELVTAHVEQHAPVGVEVSVRRLGSSGMPYLMPLDHPANEAAREIHQAMYDREPYYIRSGGSIPICGLFLEHLGVYTVGFGFGLQDENIHAPDEFFRLSSFDHGQEAYCRFLELLAEKPL